MQIRKLMPAIVLVAATWAMSAGAKDISIVVTNNEPTQRQELVEVDVNNVYSQMGVAKGTTLVVRNALGQEVDYQVTYDGKLLIDAAVRPCGQAVIKRMAVPAALMLIS